MQHVEAEWFNGCHVCRLFDRILYLVVPTATVTNVLRLPYLLKSGLSIGLILLLLAIAPFVVAQDVHHELAAADTDGHEHSDIDLCQWVQHQTAGSIDLDRPLFSVSGLVGLLDLPVLSVLLSIELASVGPSRAPPSI